MKNHLLAIVLLVIAATAFTLRFLHKIPFMLLENK